MGTEDGPLGLMAIIFPPVLMLMSVFVLHFLPPEVLSVLTVWTLASFPVGVLLGHCVLSEE